jgi:hypothetical protein
MKRSLIAALFALPALAAQAGDFSASLSIAPEWRADNRDSAYFVAPPVVPAQNKSARQDLGLRWRDGGFNAQGTLRVLAREGQTPEHHGIVNQFYYDGDLGNGNGYTLGKKVMSWGVGFGFRPLDVIQREDRRSLNPPPLTGVPLAAWEHFSADAAYTLAWTNPGYRHEATDFRDQALAARYYRLVDGNDLHAVARLSGRHALEAGAGITHTSGEEWAFHAAALYQRRYGKTLNTLAENGGGILATTNPMQEVTRRNGLKAVAGSQWTGTAGFGVLVEAWYDAEAYTRDEWRRLDALTTRQRALAGFAPASAINGNVAWSSRAFERPNLLRENLLLRLTHDDERWKPALELLVTPRDGGRVVTTSLEYQGDRQRISLGLRFLGGAADSAYAQTPAKRMAFFEWRLALP